MWVEEIRHEGPRPSELRVREAADLPQVSRLVLACPNDSTMYKDAVKTTGLEEQIMVVDIIDLVHEALMLDQEGQNIDITPPLSIEYAA